MTALYRAGAEAAEDILAEVFRVDVTKALNPLKPADFLKVVYRLQQALMGIAGPAEAATMAAALDHLDIDWTTASAAKQEAVMRAANLALRSTPEVILPQFNAFFVKAHNEVVTTTAARVKGALKLDVDVSLSLVDKQVAKKAASAQAHYVRDQYGVRADAASAKARKVVAEGLKNGLGRVEIGGQLEAAMAAVNANRSRAYYNMVASVYAGRARQYASLSTYEKGGIENYIFEAVLDEVTTLQCRFMHGRVFSVAKDLKRYKQVAAAKNPEDVTFIQPWVQVGKDDDGNDALYIKKPDGTRDYLARVDDDARGESDEVGAFASRLSDADLQAKGCTCPPLHGSCRSTIVADV